MIIYIMSMIIYIQIQSLQKHVHVSFFCLFSEGWSTLQESKVPFFKALAAMNTGEDDGNTAGGWKWTAMAWNRRQTLLRKQCQICVQSLQIIMKVTDIAEPSLNLSCFLGK